MPDLSVVYSDTLVAPIQIKLQDGSLFPAGTVAMVANSDPSVVDVNNTTLMSDSDTLTLGSAIKKPGVSVATVTVHQPDGKVGQLVSTLTVTPASGGLVLVGGWVLLNP